MAANPELMPQAPPPPMTEAPRFEAPLEPAPSPSRWALRSSASIVINATGAILVMIGLQLAWVSVSSLGWSDAFVVPFAFLWQGMDANESALTIGRVFMAVSLVGLLAVPFRITNAIRLAIGAFLLVATIVYFVQVARWDAKVVASVTIGIGTLIALPGALMMMPDHLKWRRWGKAKA